ncbi:MAG: GatB/YqeY domain-containing protein [Flavobacteriaceae bacterium]|nr:GatB/YqeY domain-containing protein [Flavobacteriaceae bacterium]
MSLLEIIDNNIKSAMKSKDSVTLESLRAVKSAILLFKTQSGSSNDISSEDEINILQKLVKQRKESADIYKNQNRLELSEVELNQASVIESYLPKQMSRDELSEVISQIITKLGATTMKEMGKVMGLASKELSGKSDGKTISEIVRKKLS